MTYLLTLIPFIALIIFNLVPKRLREDVAFWLSLAIYLAETIAALAILLGWWLGVALTGLEPILGFNLVVNKLSSVLLLSLGIVSLTALSTGRSTIKKEPDRFNFMNLLMVGLIGINGIAMANDIFSLYVFIEITAIASFILIVLSRNGDALEGAWKYLILSVIATTLLLTAIALFLLTAGSTGFSDIRAVFGSSVVMQVAALLFICGLFIKGGLVPFHGWLPDVYAAAPGAVTVYLAGIVTKASGLFALIRLLVEINGFNHPIQNILLLVGALSVVVGALAALAQKDLKRMLAYSSISQMGYIVMALGAGTNLGIIAAAFHFFNHAIFKSQLFANSAAIEESVGHRDLSKMGGLAQKMPITGITSAVAALSTAGIPPLSGFWSKLLIIVALWASGYYVYAVIAVLASVITLGYFLALQRMAFFGKVARGLEKVKEADRGLTVPALALAIITVGVGLIFPFFLGMFVR